MPISVVIPAKDAAEHIPACLDPLIAQLGSDDEVIVVDDDSRDNTRDLAKQAGALVVRRPDDRELGPYSARQYAVDSVVQSTSDWLIFLDVRCRVRPGWLQAHKSLMSANSRVGLTYSSVNVPGGPKLAQKLSERRQLFSTEKYSGEIPVHFPTCNLGVLRGAFDAVGGFRQGRAGGDADLCWKIQRDTGLTPNFTNEVFVDWIPRTKYRELLEQYGRYGSSYAQLRSTGGDSETASRAYALLLPRTIKRTLLDRRGSSSRISALDLAWMPIEASYQLNYAQSCRRLRKKSAVAGK